MNSKNIDELTIVQPYVKIGDPHLWSDEYSKLGIIFSICESLVRHKEGGDFGEYSPALAESWVVEEDAKTWTFNLRSDVPFQNGSMLKAKDVASTLERAQTRSIFKNYLNGALIETNGKNSLRIVTDEPTADLLDILVDIPIIHESALEDLPDNPVGSGPYRLLAADDNQVVMEAFTEYWAGQPRVERIIWKEEPDAEKRVEELLSGEADIASEIGYKGKETAEVEDDISVATLESSYCIVFMCNLLSGVCTDRRVRQALNYAVDRSEIIEGVMGGGARQLNGPLTSSHIGYEPSTPSYYYDPAKARDLLSEAGFERGLQLVLDIRPVSPKESREVANLMVEQYTKVGIETEIQAFDRKTYGRMVEGKNIDDACMFDSSPLSTFRVLREKLHSGLSGPWWQGYNNPEVDSLIDQAARTRDEDQRRIMYRRAYHKISGDAPWIFLYSPNFFWGVGKRARDLRIEMDGVIRF